MARRTSAITVSSLIVAYSLVISIFIPPLTAEGFSFFGSINLSDSDGFSFETRIAIPSGNENLVYVIWSDDTPGLSDIFLAASTDGGESFADAINVSVNDGVSDSPQAAAVDDNIYVVWDDDIDGFGLPNEIFFKRSTDNGQNFDSAINLSDNDGFSVNPQITASDDNVYVAWEDDTDGNNEIFFSRSTDNGQNFDSAINLSASAGASFDPRIAVSGNNVYITWVDDTDGNEEIYFIVSTDNGETFTLPLNISDSSETSLSPEITTFANNVYVVWSEGVTADVLISVSVDNGQTFDLPVNIINNSGESTDPSISLLDDGNIYVAWTDFTDGDQDILFAVSTDNGSTFSSATDLSDNDGESTNQQMAISGNNVYVTWEDDDAGIDEILLSISTDNGATFSTPINVSTNADASTFPRISAANDNIYVAWPDFTFGNGDIIFRRIVDSGPPALTIESVSDTTPRWDLDSVIVSGFVTMNSTDSVVVDWGDGDSDPAPIAANGTTWGPMNHTYGSASSGTDVSIVASLLDEFDVEKVATDPEVVSVQKHETSLTLDNILSVEEGSDIDVSGLLMDVDTDTPIEGETITFDGSGAGGLADAATIADGSYSESGASPASDVLLTVQVHYAESAEYEGSDSETRAYDSFDAGSDEFAVPPGAPVSVDLTGFNATIDFDDVASAGSIFVSECDTPASERYDSLDLCLKLSPTMELEPDSYAHISVSLNETDIPDEYSADDVSMFHEGLSGIVDITEAREVDDGIVTVTGRTANFSNFIVGAALHDLSGDADLVKQLFVGENEITFRDITNLEDTEPTISSDQSEYSAGDTPTITIVDEDANFDVDGIDTISATISSTTSSADGDSISIELVETGVNTGTFEGTFELTNSDTGGNMLEVGEGDEVTVSYNEALGTRLSLLFDDVAEAGVIEIADFDETVETSPVVIVGYEVDLDLVDASMGSGTVEVTISYANIDLESLSLEPSDLGVFHKEGGAWVDVTLPGGLDEVEKTITGEVDDLSPFSLGFVFGGPGGAGGGLPRPGSGIVLDFSVEDSGGSGGGSGGGGNRVVVVKNEPIDDDVSDAPVDTFPESHFEDHPLERVEVSSSGFMDADGDDISEASAGQQISIASTFSNHQQEPQHYSFIVMIIDEDGVAVDIAWQEGTVESGQTVDLSTSWMPQDGGTYTVKIFVWDGLENPSPLSNVTVNNINVN